MGVVKGRYTAKMDEPFVVFVIGMQARRTLCQALSTVLCLQQPGTRTRRVPTLDRRCAKSISLARPPLP